MKDSDRENEASFKKYLSVLLPEFFKVFGLLVFVWLVGQATGGFIRWLLNW